MLRSLVGGLRRIHKLQKIETPQMDGDNITEGSTGKDVSEARGALGERDNIAD